MLDFSHVTVHELQQMHEPEVRGVRLNMESGGKRVVIDELKSLMLKVASTLQDAGLEEKWFVQLKIAGIMWDLKQNLTSLCFDKR